MATPFNFPAAPTEGQVYEPTGGPRYVWRAPRWMIEGEEGLWTPAFACATGAFGTIVYNVGRGGTYTKIGNRVLFNGTMRTDSLAIGTASGGITITGLPYAATGGTYAAIAIPYSGSFVTNPDGGLIANTANYISLYKKTTLNGNSAGLIATDLTVGATAANYMMFGGHYLTT